MIKQVMIGGKGGGEFGFTETLKHFFFVLKIQEILMSEGLQLQPSFAVQV